MNDFNELFFPPPPILTRQLDINYQYVFQGQITSLDPDCPSLNGKPDERKARKIAFTAQHPNTNYAETYRQELGLNVLSVSI
jgi:hypothetical protein